MALKKARLWKDQDPRTVSFNRHKTASKSNQPDILSLRVERVEGEVMQWGKVRWEGAFGLRQEKHRNEQGHSKLCKQMGIPPRISQETKGEKAKVGVRIVNVWGNWEYPRRNSRACVWSHTLTGPVFPFAWKGSVHIIFFPQEAMWNASAATLFLNTTELKSYSKFICESHKNEGFFTKSPLNFNYSSIYVYMVPNWPKTARSKGIMGSYTKRVFLSVNL